MSSTSLTRVKIKRNLETDRLFFTRNQVPFNLFKPRVTAVLRQTRVGTLQKNPSVFLVTEVISTADQFRIISFLFLLQSLSKTFNYAGSFKEQAHGRSVQGAQDFVRIMARDTSFLIQSFRWKYVNLWPQNELLSLELAASFGTHGYCRLRLED